MKKLSMAETSRYPPYPFFSSIKLKLYMAHSSTTFLGLLHRAMAVWTILLSVLWEKLCVLLQSVDFQRMRASSTCFFSSFNWPWMWYGSLYHPESNNQETRETQVASLVGMFMYAGNELLACLSYWNSGSSNFKHSFSVYPR